MAKRAAWVSLAVLLAADASGACPRATAQPTGNGLAGGCLDTPVVRQRFADLAADDARSVDAAAASIAQGHGLTLYASLVDEIALPAVPPRARPGAGRVPLTMRETLTSMRPLDPHAPDGPSLETRAFPDGSVGVYLVEPPYVHRGCDIVPSPPAAWRFARGTDGHVTPIHVVYRALPVPVVQCGSVGCGCDGRPFTVDAFVRQYALGVHSADAVDAPLTVHADHHVVHRRYAEACRAVAPTPHAAH